MDLNLDWSDFVALIGYFTVVIGIGVWVKLIPKIYYYFHGVLTALKILKALLKVLKHYILKAKKNI